MRPSLTSERGRLVRKVLRHNTWDLNNAGWVTSFDPSDFTYRELIATGGLALIRDAELKRSLIAYYQAVDFVTQFYPLWHSTALDHYNPELRRRVSLADWAAIERSNGSASDVPIRTEAVLRDLRTGEDIEKLLVTIMVSADEHLGSLRRLRARSEALLDHLP